MLENSTDDDAAGSGTGYYPPAAEPYQQQQQRQQQYPPSQQHPHNPRHRGPGPYPPRFQTRQQWPNAGPWSKHGDFDASDDGRPFRLQNPPINASRPPGFPRPVLELRTNDHIPPDLISPRSDSFFYSSRPARPPPSPSPSVPDYQSVAYRTRADSTPTPTPTSRPPRSAFPGLSSNPYIPEDAEPEPPRSETRKFPLLARQHEQIDPSSPVSTLESPVESRTVTPTEGNMVVENFSRPRKTSVTVKSQQSDGALSRRMAAQRLQADPAALDQPTSNPLQPTHFNPGPNPWPRVRRLSGSSSQSSSTFSSIPPRPSYDQLDPASRINSLRQPNPGVPPATGSFARPPVAFHNHNNNGQPHAREGPPLLVPGDELRSSFRSQLTSSTAHGTVFTPVGTERNSILTKASSITEQSIINGYARGSWRPNSVDDGPSLEDVMGMYERGFRDSDIESMRRSMKFYDDDDVLEKDLERDLEKDLDTGVPEMEGSRPGSAHSDASGLREKMLEAMTDSLPPPGAVQIPGSGRTQARESLSNTRRSLLPNSLPNEVGLGLAAESMRKRESTDPDVMEKHDSAKLLDDGDDDDDDGDDGDDDSAILPAQSTAPPSPTSPTSPAQAEPPIVNLPPAPPTVTTAPAPRLPQEPPEEPGSRDRYGFRKAGANITRQEYDAWDAGYTEYLARRRKKWIAFLKDNSLMTDRPNRFPPRSTKTKRFIRKGIPPDWRGAAWFYYAGGPAILSKHKGVYELLLRRAGLAGSSKSPDKKGEVKPLIVDDIEKDLYRTFPDNVQFKPPPPQPGTAAAEGAASEPPPEPPIIGSLRRVLHAFALYNPRIGYCQSLNFLAGLLLLFVETEEQAFWLLNIITRVYLPGTHEMSLEGSKVDLGVLMVALKDSMPAVWKQIGGDELEASKKTRGRRGKRGHVPAGSINDPNRLPAITLCMTAWFMSCFIGTLPIETVLRVWDVFFYEGSRTLFRIALTIFKLGEREIKAVQDPMEMFGVVQTFPRRMIDCNTLMETCYKRRNGIGHLSQESVEEKRQERRDGIRKWKAEQEAAASDTNNSPRPATTATGGRHRFGVAALGLDLAADLDEARRRGNLFSRRKGGAGAGDQEQARAAEVV